MAKRFKELRGVVKNGLFTVSPLGPDHKQMLKICPKFFIEIGFFDTQNTFYLIVRGLKNAFFMPFKPPLHHYPTILWKSNSKQ